MPLAIGVRTIGRLKRSAIAEVIGPKSVPRFTHRLLEHELINEDDIYRIHQQAPEKMYGIEVSL